MVDDKKPLHREKRQEKQPVEIAPSCLFLATADPSCMTGQVLHPNGGRIVNG